MGSLTSLGTCHLLRLAVEKEVRNTFRRFMALDADKWDWKAPKVPNPLTKWMEESQQAKQDFEVDENSLEYRALHPLAAPAQQSSVKEHFEPIEEDEDQSVSDAEDDQPSDDEPANGKSKDGKKSRAPR
ncbi:embryo sac development arrest 7 [Artemisia annua]|uniref:Embryo sac development arrest 7 n=1 Tax=Artemisia annua TaxID=35608 RepID=A0A2U1Q0P0_ARTAN|nr:embryo sac development arrest 7 [Artemisia annua]